MVPARSGSWARSNFGEKNSNTSSRRLLIALLERRRATASEVPLFEKEGLGEIFRIANDFAA
jgi:hypothetical protein